MILLCFFSLLFQACPNPSDLDVDECLPFLNLDERYSDVLFDSLIQVRDIKALPIKECDNNQLIPLLGHTRDFVFKILDKLGVLEYNEELFYMGSKKINRKISYHFILVDRGQFFQDVFMLSDDGTHILSIIHVEHYSNFPLDGDLLTNRLVKISGSRCIIESYSQSADTSSGMDGLPDECHGRLILSLKKGKVIRYRFYKRTNTGNVLSYRAPVR